MKESVNWYQGCAGEVNPKELPEYEATGFFIAEPKMDGIWAVCFAGRRNRFFSRNQKEKTIPELAQVKLPTGTVLVGELAYGQQEASKRVEAVGHPFMDVFDVLRVGHVECWRDGDNERRAALEKLMRGLPRSVRDYFRLVPRWTDDFERRFQEQPEGLVLKQIKGCRKRPYLRGTRNPYWLKVKKLQTYDLVVMDYTISQADSYKGKNIAQGLSLGAYKDGKLVHVCNCGNGLTLEQKRDIPRNWNRWKGCVVEVAANKKFTSGALRHPRLIRVRQDKAARDCRW